VTAAASRGPLRRFVNRLEVDRAVFYALCLRVWQFVAGPISMLLIGRFFSPDLQGYYFTFASLVALQSFLELGFQIVILNVSSHEWAHLQLDETGTIAGDAAARSRLASLARLLLAWYGVAALLFVIGVGPGGAWFLAQKAADAVSWQAPWAVLVVLSAGMLWVLPFVVMLDACGQMAVVNRYRLGQAVTANLAVWACVLLGAGLWAAVAAAAVQLLGNLWLTAVRYRRFFRVVRQPPSGPRLRWRADLWPMQWRLAISGVASYFAFALFTPVMFHYHGAAVAGQMGMTWQLVTLLQAAALAWVQARAPLFGRLVARHDYRELDRVFFRLTGISWVVLVAGAVAAGLVVWGLGLIDFWLARRLLGPLPTALFLLAIVAYHFPNCQAYYVRAHKQEPLLVLSVVTSLLVGGAVWWFGGRDGPTAAAWAYLAIVVGVVCPWQTAIWWRCRRAHLPCPRLPHGTEDG
jgi:O-antigen/teichoic acid export membrane protein